MPYDPLRAALPKSAQAHPNTYWLATADASPPDDGPLCDDIQADLVIIGGGYTGLSCAHRFAARYGVKAVVLEAHSPGWGCSGRNGSFARPALGRLSYQEWVQRWGVEKSKALFVETLQALASVRAIIEEGNIACQKQPEGWLKIAHREDKVRSLAREHKLLKDVFGFETELLDRGAIRDRCFLGDEAYGALRFPQAFGMHPLNLAYGLLRMAREAGAVVHGASPVIGWDKERNEHVLQTPGARVRAKQVIIATNGYTTERLHPSLKGRLLPVLSNIIVTRPMNEAEQSECGLRTTDIMTDTRNILNYYRRLPDGRLLLGSRGPILEGSVENERHQAILLQSLKRKFPALRDISVDYWWGGWVAITRDMLPHIHHAQDDTSVWYAMGYNGSGVAAAVYAGQRLADRLAGDEPIFSALDTPVPRIPLASFRRVAQRAMFAWYRLQDERIFSRSSA